MDAATALLLLDERRKVVPFVPSDLSGLICWFDPAQETGLSDDDRVGTLTDHSGSGSGGTASGDPRPTYKTGIKNGKPVIRFDGSDDSITWSGISEGAGDWTIIFALDLVARGGYLFDTTTGRLLFNTDYSAGGATNAWAFYDSAWDAYGGASEEDWQIMSWVLTSTPSVYKNGSALSSVEGSNSYTQRALGGGDTQFGSGKAPSVWTQFDLGQFLIYDSALSDADRQSVENYLNRTFGIY